MGTRPTETSAVSHVVVNAASAHRQIVDWLKVQSQIANSIDVATGDLSIGLLAVLEPMCHMLGKARILLGYENPDPPTAEVQRGWARIQAQFETSLAPNGSRTDVVNVTAAMAQAVRSSCIVVRLCREAMSRLTTYIAHPSDLRLPPAALVDARLSGDVKLEVQGLIVDLQKWYEDRWDLASDVTGEFLSLLERCTGKSPLVVVDQAEKRHMRTLTNLERTSDTLVHPIAFFDRRSHFSRLRWMLDGDHLIRQYFGRLLEEECGYETEEILSELRGLTDMAPLVWSEKQQKFVPGPAPRPVGHPAHRVLAHAAGGGGARTLVLDPVIPSEDLGRGQNEVIRFPRMADGANDDFRYHGRFWCDVQCAGIAQDSWNMLAFIGPQDIPRLADALGAPSEPRGADAAEALLRQAFAEKTVRENGELSSILARLPLLFAKADQPDQVHFEFHGIPRGGDYEIPHSHWVVAVVDTAAYLRKRH